MPRTVSPTKDAKKMNTTPKTVAESDATNKEVNSGPSKLSMYAQKLIAYRPKSYIPFLVFLLIVASFLLGVLLTKVYYLENGVGGNTVVGQPELNADSQQPVIGEKVDVGVGHLPPLGNKDAKVKIVEFADYRCPFCEVLYKESEPKIVKDYVDTGKAVFYFRHFAFLGEASTLAANAAECANEQNKFWEMHAWLYDNQPPESDVSMYTVEKLTEAAGSLGLNTSQFNQCLTSNKYQANVDKDIAEGQTAGVSGTPTLFINGKPIIGAEPYETIKAQIDAALAE